MFIGLCTLALLPQTPGLSQFKSEWSAYGRQHGYDVSGAYHQEVNVKSWRVVASVVRESDMGVAKKFWLIFKSEFSKYPACFLKKSKLKEVDFVTNLSISGQPRGAMPDYVNQRLVLDVNLAKQPEWYARHVIHHEFYHLIENSMNGSTYFKDPVWAKMNELGFGYGQGGAKMRDSSVTPLVHPQKGFVNTYSTSGLEEDKAEVWAVMFCSRDWSTVKPWLQTDSVLSSKVRYLEAFAAKACPEMGAAFWETARKG